MRVALSLVSIVCTLAAGLSGCSNSAPEAPEADSVVDHANSPPYNDAENAMAAANFAVEPSSLTKDERSKVCRAAIADLNGHSPKIVQVLFNDGETVRVGYTRPDDGKKWINECRFGGNRVIWRSVDAFGEGGGAGRWRDNPLDETVTFKLDGDRVSITTTYEGGSGETETYTVR